MYINSWAGPPHQGGPPAWRRSIKVGKLQLDLMTYQGPDAHTSFKVVADFLKKA